MKIIDTHPHRSRSRRFTLRTRLTLTYAGLVSGSGAVLITIVQLYMRFVPLSFTFLLPDQGYVVPLSSEGELFEFQSALLQDFLNRMLLISIAALILLTLTSGLVGWIVAGQVLTPLATMSQAAARAARGDLDQPLALEGSQDEIRELADTFDHMQDSLRTSLAAHTRFAANASHELRTPLATTQTMIDVALSDPDAGVEDLRALAQRVREVSHASVETIDALLDLAHAQSGTPTFEPVNLSDLVRSVMTANETEAAERNLRVLFREYTGTHDKVNVIVPGDFVLLRQAISNLVSNATKYNVEGGLLDVTIYSGSEVKVVVANDGEVVPEDSLANLTEPFVRGSGRGTTRGNGHGLGLAIVQAVATAHRGSLALTARPEGGLIATLALPAEN